jgi:exopolysaccharide/PEP-CTERM locus tyrosine autokinase
MSSNNKENTRATIAELVARSGSKERDFSRPAPAADRQTEPVTSTMPVSSSITILESLRDQDMLVAGSRLGPSFSDEYRRIKRPLLSNAFGKTASLVERGNLVLITSSVPGEGKSHTAVNLALSIAQERDHTVLLMDCDVTRKGVSHMLDLAEKPGLVELLENDNLSVGDVLLRTDIPQLTVLSAGKQHEYVTELLASQRMAALVDEIATRYDDRVIILDGPPLLPTPQTQVLETLVGQIVFVIEAGKTPQAVVEEALALIPEDKAAGVVLNKSEGVFERSGYYYSYYGSDQEKSKKKS